MSLWSTESNCTSADAQAAYAERLLDEDERPRAFDPWDDHGGAFKPPRFQKYVADLDHPARRDAIVDGDEDALDADLFALEVAFQQHVCVKNFCNKPGNPACKRRYPRALTDRSIMSKTKDAKGHHRASLQTPRNHRWVVPYNRHLLQAWRGNVDVQVISDPKGAAAYAAAIACYSTKPDTPDNQEVDRALCGALTAANERRSAAKTLLSKATNAVLGKTPISAQRAAWYFLGFDFVASSRTVKRVRVPKPPAPHVDQYVAATRKSRPDAAGELATMLPRRTLNNNHDTSRVRHSQRIGARPHHR